MICPYCRQNSATDSVCSQCRRPTTTAAPPYGQQPTQTMPSQTPVSGQPTQVMPPQTQQRVSLTGEVMDIPIAPPPTQTPYPGQPGGYQGSAPSLAAQREMFYAEGPDSGELWEKFFAFGFPILAAGMLTAHLIPGSFLWVTLTGLALTGLSAYFVFRES